MQPTLCKWAMQFLLNTPFTYMSPIAPHFRIFAFETRPDNSTPLQASLGDWFVGSEAAWGTNILWCSNWRIDALLTNGATFLTSFWHAIAFDLSEVRNFVLNQTGTHLALTTDQATLGFHAFVASHTSYMEPYRALLCTFSTFNPRKISPFAAQLNRLSLRDNAT